jgi:hypothetical protein
MKKTFVLMFLCMMVAGALWAYPCVAQDYDTQKGAVLGAIGGALAGQAISRNTAGTLIGAAGGALVGDIAGNAAEQAGTQTRLAQAEPPAPQGYGPPPPGEAPPPAGYGPPPPGEAPPPAGYGPPPPEGYGPPPPAPQGYGPPPPAGYGPPPYAFAAPPAVVPIPGTYAYFVPGIGVDVLFYQGYWYRPFRGRWYGAQFYNGPWIYVPGPRVPRVLFSLPPGWRRVPRGYRPIPHAELQRNWQRWGRERHWEGHR